MNDCYIIMIRKKRNGPLEVLRKGSGKFKFFRESDEMLPYLEKAYGEYGDKNVYCFKEIKTRIDISISIEEG